MVVFGIAILLFFTAAALAQIPRQAKQCSGYRATNVVQADSYLVADLELIGNCTLYSKDVGNLRLLVEYQTGNVADLLGLCERV
jgi:alpha-glucosidase